ncbi:alpha/beta hydrolase [Maricaulaceae bacterium EIL42A08]|nr:alpha/beta hydrolase [Maricaulaceae bacterium EIL42A08]
MLQRILGALILVIVVLVAVFAFLMQKPDLDEVRAEWMTPDDRLVNAAGMQWRVRETGPEDAAAIVLIHGFSHSLEAFEAVSVELDSEYRVIRFDLPGHALTGPREDAAYSVDDTLAQMTTLLDEIAPDTFAIGGNSLGGLLAWRYAAANPERVTDLVLISPGGYPNLGVGDEPAPVPAQVSLYLTTAPQAGVQAATAALYADPSRLSEADVERIGALMRFDGVGEALVQRIEQFTLPDPNPTLRTIEADTLVIWGARDVMISPLHGPRFAAAIPNAELLLISDAGHMAQSETPGQVSQAVRALLAD